jgi:hypothetical protein
MTNIVERLRYGVNCPVSGISGDAGKDMLEAANVIEAGDKLIESIQQQLALAQRRIDWEADRAAKLDVELEDTRQQLAECQAREKRAGEILLEANAKLSEVDNALAYLKRWWQREVLLETAEFYPDEPAYFTMENPNTFQDGAAAFRNELRRKAKELE